MTDLALVAACEQRIVNAWPAPTTLLIGDWVVRMAHGYSGRANAATPLQPGADLDDTALGLIESLYREAGLPPCIRTTPLAAPRLTPRLAERGYTIKDSSFGMIAPVTRLAAPPEPGLTIETPASDTWIQQVAGRQEGAKRNAAHIATIVGAIRMSAGFATLATGGVPAAFGMTVTERGMAEIGLVVVDAERRGQGLGRKLVSALMDWAAASGATQAYLQVDQTNAAAVKLYRYLGFEIAYAYETRVLR